MRAVHCEPKAANDQRAMPVAASPDPHSPLTQRPSIRQMTSADAAGGLAGFTSPVPYTRDQVKAAPQTRGVHVVWGPDAGDEVVYVGQTGKLRTRLMQHLRGDRKGSVLHEQIGKMLDESAPGSASGDVIRAWLERCRVAWKETEDSKFVKHSLVQEYDPRFNRLRLDPLSLNPGAAAVVARLTSLKLGTLPSGAPAPHKPLLVLVGLVRLEDEVAEGLVQFDEIARPLRTLLAQRPEVAQELAPELPFWNLQRDGVWVVRDDDGPLLDRHPTGEPPPSLLRAPDVVGGFTPDVAKVLTDADVLQAAITAVATKYFADEADDVIAAVRAEVAAAEEGRVWWVNQGLSYRPERDGWYVWAPQLTKAGTSVAHHSNVGLLREGNVIVHYANKAVRAISQVAAHPEEALRPAGLPGEPWSEKGRYCITEYFELDEPILLTDVDERGPKVGPFDMNGSVKQGYLFDVDPTFAELFSARFAARWPAGSPLAERSRGYWLFQSVPTQWSLEEFLSSAAVGDETDYSLTRYREEVAVGDAVLLWQAGVQAGIYALGEIVREPFERDRPAFRGEGRPTEWATRVRIKHILQSALSKAEVVDSDDLGDLLVLRAPQGTNYRITIEEWRAVLQRVFSPSEATVTAPSQTVTLADAVTDLSQRLVDANLRFGDSTRHIEFVRASLVSLATKRFLLLAGLSGSGKTRLGLAIGQWFGVDQHLVIPVRPDWTGPDALLGFENSLTSAVEGQHAWSVPAGLEFILRAAKDPTRPYLLLLDEMNLAHVERYFADVLSGMESDQPIIPNLARSAGEWRLVDAELLPFPHNLFVVGTVNIDETTYMFSPKVLDRANTLEFRVRTDDLQVAAGAPTEIVSGPDEIVQQFLFSAASTADTWDGSTKFSNWLRSLHALLSSFDREFGHRVFFEAMRFGSLMRAAGETDPLVALDLQVLQKVLPRIHGSLREVDGPLTTLAAWTFAGPDSPIPDNFDPLAPPSATPVLPASFDKARRMLRRLRDNHFVSFAE